MEDDILFIDVKESYRKPLLLFDIAVPVSLTTISKKVNDDGSDHELKKEIMDGVRVYVQPATRRIEVYILYQGKKLREFGAYYYDLKIENYNQFPVLPLVIDDNTWRIEIAGNFNSRITFNESQINRVISDNRTRRKWDDITEDDMELNMVISKPERFTVIAAYEQNLKEPQTIEKPDIINIYCNRKTYTIKIEALKNDEIIFMHLVKIRASCFIKELQSYPEKNIIMATDDHRWLCLIEGKQGSSISIESDFLKDMIEAVNKIKAQQEAKKKEAQKEQLRKMLDIIDGERKPNPPQKIMKFQNPDNVFIFGSSENNEKAELYEHLSEAEIHFAPATDTLILLMKPEGRFYPEMHRFSCKRWRIMWNTDSDLGTEDYCFCSDDDIYFSVSSGKDTKIQCFMDIYDRIEIIPKG